MMEKYTLIQGNEACVLGAMAAGMSFYAGYPITPSTEIAELSALLLPKSGGTFIQMEDEIGSLMCVLGAAAAGRRAMTATSGPGFSLMQESIGYAVIAELPCVIVNVQRQGPSTGMPTSPSQGDLMQCRWGTHGDHPIITLSPSSVEETYTLIMEAFTLAERYRTPVIFLMDEMIGHLRAGVALPELPEPPRLNCEFYKTAPYCTEPGEYVPHMPPIGYGQRYNITGLIHDESGFPTNSNAECERLLTRLNDKIEKNLDEICRSEEYLTGDADVLITCFGGAALAVRAAVDMLRAEGIRAGMFRPVTVWPFPAEAFKRAARQANRRYAAELNMGQMAQELEKYTSGREVGRICKYNGQPLYPKEITARIKEEISHGG